MPVVKRFTQAQWDAAARRLDALPDKPAHEHHVTVRDAVQSMQPQIRGAQQKGYTLDEIIQQLAEAGVEISASTLRYAMQRTAKDSRAKLAAKTGQAARTTPSPRTKKPQQTRPPRVDHAQDQGRQDGGSAATNPGTMVIQDAFSFEIAPDTENL
ncbi:hypothetical protein WT26_25110 [Burkholderia cepacia]|uniref:Uncharacterized protein n=2 Tax=Burkholderia cepacia complex TaxID=87882 RepID=A0A1B4PZ63_BURCE|nr:MULTISPECIES: hypothetical protein [Burkholderia cepacia complex]AOK19229.1 hypothetical protein WT26_25110 [Burkholderia cepacia]AOK25987.1 hypothetical protein WK67_24990 [Burkholderia ubonensis]